MEKKKLHSRLINLIKEKGISLPKKHGKWAKFELDKNMFFQVDTYNSEITLRQGSGEYNFWTGFSGSSILYFGCDFGKFESHVSNQTYLSAISCITNQLTTPQG